MSTVVVTSAQVAAARAMVRRWQQTGRPVRPAVLRIAQARVVR